MRLKSVSGYERFFWGVFSVIMFSISGAMLFSLIRFKKERSHRNYLVTLSENEQRLRNNEREREELEECLKEMSLTDEEREHWRVDPALFAKAAGDVRLMLSASPVAAIRVDDSILTSKSSLLVQQAEYRLRVHKRMLHWVFLDNETGI